MDLGIKGRRALVLGSSQGLGAAIATALAQEGAIVTAAARNTDKIKDWAGNLTGGAAGNVQAAHVDLADVASVDALAESLLRSGGVDILVLNSGGPPPGEARSAARSDWTAQFEAMAANLFHLAGRLLPAMEVRKWGRIIVLGSSGIEQPIPRLALSNAIRASVLGWAKTLSAEVAANGVTVNVVLPGRIHTERVDQLDAATASRQQQPVEDVAAASRATIPAGRYGAPQEFADVVAFLASERASYVTGAKIRVDGGAIRSV
ncbi:SDR family NAD(P)-dependent oxidoreductase [Paracoccus suum]|uniref:SDR family NAD(P)-dependent oxidoreductase n=1 Tax=Paracoccus suum TaxID=2259340 RepID=A0A344PLC3_9RHOB|nr:SDR family oxidoreductase [Paracoccus suum]AXC50178.1 SDR family NAD(P)-dependent oxidoreductase [Paracoccus suum]